jgi:hypothetical protein
MLPVPRTASSCSSSHCSLLAVAAVPWLPTLRMHLLLLLLQASSNPG